MPTENRRVAAYLPKYVDDRLEAFKTERGLKGDSPALVVILEEYFGVSQEVAYSSSSDFTNLVERVQKLESQNNRPSDELLSELQGELFDRLKPDLKSELLSELLSELKNTSDEIPASSQLDIIPAEQIEQNAVPSSSSQNELLDESLNSDLNEVDQSFDQIPLPQNQEVDQEALTNGELPDSAKSKPLDGSVPWKGLELSDRLKTTQSTLSAKFKQMTEEEFAEWTRKREEKLGLEGLSWRRIGLKYVPIVDAPEEF